MAMLDVTGRRDAVESWVIAPMRGRVAVIEAEADIRRSPEDVFDYASDPAHEPEWNIRMKRLEKLTDGPVRLGAGYRMEFTKGPPAISECVRFERPSLWELAGGSKVISSGLGAEWSPTVTAATCYFAWRSGPAGYCSWHCLSCAAGCNVSWSGISA